MLPTVAQSAALQPSPKTRPRRAAAYLQALEMQERLRADVLDTRVKAADRAACARAWDILEDRKRILRNRPLPGQLRPDLMPKATRTKVTFRSSDVIDLAGEPKESLSLPQTVSTPGPRERQLPYISELGVPSPQLEDQSSGKEDTNGK